MKIERVEIEKEQLSTSWIVTLKLEVATFPAISELLEAIDKLVKVYGD